MKTRVSATIDPETGKIIEKLMKAGKYRNISHLIEDAIISLGEKKNDK